MSDDLIAILGIVAMVLWVIRACWREHWKQEAFERGERVERLLDDLDLAVSICADLTKELRIADELAIKQARKSLRQQERIAQLEARSLELLTVLTK